jgi:hypothetical protein
MHARTFSFHLSLPFLRVPTLPVLCLALAINFAYALTITWSYPADQFTMLTHSVYSHLTPYNLPKQQTSTKTEHVNPKSNLEPYPSHSQAQTLVHTPPQGRHCLLPCAP